MAGDAHETRLAGLLLAQQPGVHSFGPAGLVRLVIAQLMEINKIHKVCFQPAQGTTEGLFRIGNGVREDLGGKEHVLAPGTQPQTNSFLGNVVRRRGIDGRDSQIDGRVDAVSDSPGRCRFGKTHRGRSQGQGCHRDAGLAQDARGSSPAGLRVSSPAAGSIHTQPHCRRARPLRTGTHAGTAARSFRTLMISFSREGPRPGRVIDGRTPLRRGPPCSTEGTWPLRPRSLSLGESCIPARCRPGTSTSPSSSTGGFP